MIIHNVGKRVMVFGDRMNITQRGIMAPVPGWWLSGGIAAGNCVAAYQPKGAASYAASKVNLHNPGVHDATDGAAFPTWAADTGWFFVSGSFQKLITDILPDATYSVLVKVVNGRQVPVSAQAAEDNTYHLYLNFAGQDYFRNGGSYNQAATANAVFGIVGSNACVNGVFVGVIGAGAHNFAVLRIGVQGPVSGYYDGYIYALAVYNATLTEAQALAVSTAMAAL